jgi:hypothetical protein
MQTRIKIKKNLSKVTVENFQPGTVPNNATEVWAQAVSFKGDGNARIIII